MDSEPIEVIAYFKGLDMKVIRFRRDKSVYNVSHVLSRWKRRVGENLITHFMVQCKQQKVSCEIAFTHNALKWELIKLDNFD